MCPDHETGPFGVVLKMDLGEEVDMKEKEGSETNQSESRTTAGNMNCV